MYYVIYGSFLSQALTGIKEINLCVFFPLVLFVWVKERATIIYHNIRYSFRHHSLACRDFNSKEVNLKISQHQILPAIIFTYYWIYMFIINCLIGSNVNQQALTLLKSRNGEKILYFNTHSEPSLLLIKNFKTTIR